MRPKKNMAVVFDNYEEAAPLAGDIRCEHAGTPPAVGTKYAINVRAI